MFPVRCVTVNPSCRSIAISLENLSKSIEELEAASTAALRLFAFGLDNDSLEFSLENYLALWYCCFLVGSGVNFK